MCAAFAEFKWYRASQVKATTARFAEAEFARESSLLAFRWRSSLFDGAATPLTSGFLNDDYMPPWDTWLHTLCIPDLDDDPCCLISWVPSFLTAEVDSAMFVDPARSLSWCVVSSTGALTLRRWCGAFK